LEGTNPVIKATTPHPLLILGDDAISKIRKFSIPDLDRAFEPSISVAGNYPPLSHYPFSDQDNDAIILPIILRKLVQLAFNKNRGGQSALEESTFNSQQVVESTHPYWDALSSEHRNRLADRIRNIMKRLITDEPVLREYIETLEARDGYMIRGPLIQLQEIALKIIADRETQARLNSFPSA